MHSLSAMKCNKAYKLGVHKDRGRKEPFFKVVSHHSTGKNVREKNVTIQDRGNTTSQWIKEKYFFYIITL